MTRLVRDARLETREARRRLVMRKMPYWRLVIEGIHLGYYKGKSGVWYLRSRTPEGKYLWHTLGLADDIADANDKTVLSYPQAQQRARKIGDKVRNGFDVEDTKPYTVSNAVTAYIIDFKANGKKSLYITETQINSHILPFFGDKLVSSLSYNQLNDWKNKLATTSKRARSSKKGDRIQKFIVDEDNNPEYQRRRRATTNHIISIFKAILNHAYNTNRVPSDEAWNKLKPFKNVSEPKIRFLSESEAILLINASEPDFKLLVRGALLTGARYGELTAIKVGEYSTDNNAIYINKSKNGKSRHIPLNQEGINFFSQLIIGKSSGEYIFTRTDNKPWKKNYQVRPLSSACKLAKIEPEISFHDLRHTYASALAMRGVPLQVISTVLGHSDTRITHKHYAHLLPSYVADVIQQHLPDFGRTENLNVTLINKMAYETISASKKSVNTSMNKIFNNHKKTLNELK